MAKTSIKRHLDSVVEFERTPVPESHWKGWGSFIGMYAGEHTAGNWLTSRYGGDNLRHPGSH